MQNPYLTFALDLAHAAGDIMRQHFSSTLAVERKSDNSPVTIADTSINAMVIERIMAAYPDHGILGEEQSHNPGTSKYTWVCDPIDGTMPFIFHLPISMFSLALVEDGVPILGVLYNPFTEQLFTAEKGKGAFMNNTPIHVSSHATVAKAMIGNESGRLSALDPVLYTMKARMSRFYCTTCVGALVANGQYDALLFGVDTTWDIAAIKVIVEEAGGKVTDKEGNEQRYDRPINGAIVSNGLIHEELLEMVQSLTQSPVNV